ncbi:MAG: hypothetical protein JNG84_10335 [Archangium sp.]|nr:hypothetical protein [Archangium sp.]
MADGQATSNEKTDKDGEIRWYVNLEPDGEKPYGRTGVSFKIQIAPKEAGVRVRGRLCFEQKYPKEKKYAHPPKEKFTDGDGSVTFSIEGAANAIGGTLVWYEFNIGNEDPLWKAPKFKSKPVRMWRRLYVSVLQMKYKDPLRKAPWSKFKPKIIEDLAKAYIEVVNDTNVEIPLIRNRNGRDLYRAANVAFEGIDPKLVPRVGVIFANYSDCDISTGSGNDWEVYGADWRAWRSVSFTLLDLDPTNFKYASVSNELGDYADLDVRKNVDFYDIHEKKLASIDDVEGLTTLGLKPGSPGMIKNPKRVSVQIDQMAVQFGARSTALGYYDGTAKPSPYIVMNYGSLIDERKEKSPIKSEAARQAKYLGYYYTILFHELGHALGLIMDQLKLRRIGTDEEVAEYSKHRGVSGAGMVNDPTRHCGSAMCVMYGDNQNSDNDTKMDDVKLCENCLRLLCVTDMSIKSMTRLKLPYPIK